MVSQSSTRDVTANLATPTSDPGSGFHDIKVQDGHGHTLTISFQRTIRVPDNGETYSLPPGCGKFPIYSVSNYASKFPDALAKKGGAFISIHKREAMWIRFSGGYEFAVKVYAGGVNAVSGEVKVLNERQGNQSSQDYMVPPRQMWLDGIASANGKVAQFVADPVGSDYSLEAQLPGSDSVAGLQFEIIPRKPIAAQSQPGPAGCPAPPPVGEMAIAPGGLIRQTIVKDILPKDAWDVEKMALFNVQLIDATSCAALGLPVPSTPVTAQTYAYHGYPFFKMYEEPSNISGNFPVKSIGTMDQAAGLNAETHAAEKGLQFPTKVILNTVDQMSNLETKRANSVDESRSRR